VTAVPRPLRERSREYDGLGQRPSAAPRRYPAGKENAVLSRLPVTSLVPLAISIVSVVVAIIALAEEDGKAVQPLQLQQQSLGPIKIVQRENDYALKVDQYGAADAVNVASTAKEATALGVVAANQRLSTVKVTNTAAQDAGAVIAALATNMARQAPVFRAETSGTGASFDALNRSPGAIGLRLKAHSSQVADLVQLKTATGVVMTGFDGRFRLFIHRSLTTGSAPLPALPAGFIVVNVGRKQMRIPFYG